jgi:tetrahydromethanopterin S-methyltransferase subunit F
MEEERGAGEHPQRGVMIPERAGRSRIETFVMRLVATAGIIGIGVAIAAIMHSQKSQGWLIGLVVSIVSVILAAFLWSSRRL